MVIGSNSLILRVRASQDFSGMPRLQHFKIGFTCHRNFWLKDISLLINTLASKFVLAPETCSKMASTLKKDAFLSKSSKFY